MAAASLCGGWAGAGSGSGRWGVAAGRGGAVRGLLQGVAV